MAIAFGFGPRFFFVSCSFMNSAIAGVSLRFLLDSRLATPSWSVFGVFENLKLRNFSRLHFVRFVVGLLVVEESIDRQQFKV